MEERAFLPTMERIVRRVKVEDHLALTPAQGAHAELEQQSFRIQRPGELHAQRQAGGARDPHPVQRHQLGLAEFAQSFYGHRAGQSLN